MTVQCKCAYHSEALAELVKRERKRLGLTRYAFASRIGIHQSYITLMDRDGTVPSLAVLCSIADVIGIPRQDMVTLAYAEAIKKQIPKTRVPIVRGERKPTKQRTPSWPHEVIAAAEATLAAEAGVAS